MGVEGGCGGERAEPGSEVAGVRGRRRRRETRESGVEEERQRAGLGWAWVVRWVFSFFI